MEKQKDTGVEFVGCLELWDLTFHRHISTVV